VITAVIVIGASLVALGFAPKSVAGKHAAAPVISVTPTAVVSRVPAGSEWTYRIDEATFSRAANAWAAQQPPLPTPLGDVRLQNLTATLRDDQLVIRGEASAGVLTQPVSLTATAQAIQGRVLLRIKQMSAGALAVPDSTRGLVEGQLQHQLDGVLAGQHAVIDSVRIANGTLSLSGRPV
jgi:hypothetical protein